MPLIRKPAVADFFYPGDKATLNKAIKTYLGAPSFQTETRQKPKALIVPHAGYVYSGQVAGMGYSLLNQIKDTIQTVVLFGPAHRLHFKGIATSKADFFSTPLGELALDKKGISSALTHPAVHYEDRAFDGEHCLEVQLPFLQTQLSEFSIIPFLVGEIESQSVEAVMNLLWGGKETLIIVSSDLSHFLSYEECVERDKKTALAIRTKAYDSLQYHDACGRLPIQGLLRVAAKKGLKIDELAICNSGDTAGSKDRVVGYGTWLLSEA